MDDDTVVHTQSTFYLVELSPTPHTPHPHPSQNEERVWIAEQKVEAEKKRIEEFKRQMEEERQIEEMRRLQEAAGARVRQDRLEWMYNAPMSAEAQGPTAEDIFSGKVGAKEEEEAIKKVNDGAVVGAKFLAKPANAKTDAFVIKSEDPLFAIKRDEQEARTRILNNPFEMRRIKALVR